MGRPKKEQPAAIEPGESIVQMAPESEAEEMALPKLKRCPVCDGEAEVFKDRHSLYRCACKACGFWDSVPNYTARAAAKSWNAAGGPNKEE